MVYAVKSNTNKCISRDFKDIDLKRTTKGTRKEGTPEQASSESVQLKFIMDLG
jgi:hypothetical protein